MRDTRSGGEGRRRLNHRQQQVVHAARELVQAPHGSKRHQDAATNLAKLGLSEHELQLAARAAKQHREHLDRMQANHAPRLDAASHQEAKRWVTDIFPARPRLGMSPIVEHQVPVHHLKDANEADLMLKQAGVHDALMKTQMSPVLRGVRKATQDLLGPSITAFAHGEHASKSGVALDAAMLVDPTKAGDIVRGARGAVGAIRAGEKGVEVLRAAKAAAKAEKAAPAAERASLAKWKRSRQGKATAAELKTHPERAKLHAQIDTYDLKPAEKKAIKQHVDHQVTLKAHQTGMSVDQIMTDPLVQDALKPFHGYSPERTAANLRSKLNPRMVERGLQGNEALAQNGQHVLGPILPEEWVKRVVHTMPEKTERDKWAKWYNDVLPLFVKTFGEDAPRVLRGFAVSQANASPTSGLQAVFRVIDKVDRGEPIASNEISAVVKSIEDAVKGDPVSKGVAAKLSDFIDSLMNRDTRTWMGGAPEGGAPTAIDVHALRDLGYVDKKIVSRLEDRGLVAGKDFFVDSPGVAKGPMYERALEQYQGITDHLNEIGFDGRHDWKPAEVQALGWASIQKFHGANPQDLIMAIDNNTRTVSAEVSGMGRFGGTEMPSLDTRNVPYDKGLAVTQTVMDRIVPDLADAARVRIRGIDYGPGGYLDDITPSAQIQVLGSPEQVERFRDLLGATLHQWEVWATKPGRTGKLAKAAIELHAPEFSDPARVESFWRKLHEVASPAESEALAGFAPFKAEDGSDWLRIITPTGYQQPGKVQAFIDKYSPVLERAAAEEGISVRAAFNHVEVRAGGSGDAGAAYLDRLASTVPDARGVVDRASAEADAAFRDAISGNAAPPRGRLGGDGLSSGINPGFDDNTEHGLLGDWFQHLRSKGEAPAPEAPHVPTEGELAAGKVMEGMKGVPTKQREQKILQSEERGARAGLAEEAMAGVKGLEEKLVAAKQALEGALPKLQHDGIRGLSETEIDHVTEIIEAHPDLRFYERLRAMDALRNAWHGTLPTPSELKLLKRALGPQITREAFMPTKLQKYKHVVYELTNMPRSLMASFDVSAPFRQGLVAFATHPLLTAKNLKPMFKYFASEHGYQDLMRSIDERPNRDLYAKAKLAITDVEHSLEGREEQFMSSYAEKLNIPIGKGHSVGPGHIVRGSGRAYTGFLVKTRADMFDYLIEAAAKSGKDITDEKFLKDLGNYVNASTGRGSLGNLEGAAVALNSTFFSPRLMASRLTFLNPLSYHKLDPFVRRQKLKSAFALAGAIGATLWLAKMGGASVGLDPFNADFGKAKFGDTRFDISGGFAGYTRMMGAIGMAATGHDPNRKVTDTLVRFFRGKLAPIPSIGADIGTHTDYSGYRTPKWGSEVTSLFIPLLAQDVAKVVQNKDSIGKVAATAVGSAIGVGVNTYKATPSRGGSQKKDPTEKFNSKYEKTIGKLPPEVRAAEETKTMYQSAEQHRKDELGVSSLTPEQRTYVKLAVITAQHPELKQSVDALRLSLDEPGSSEVAKEIDNWAEDQLGWRTLEAYQAALR